MRRILSLMVLAAVLTAAAAVPAKAGALSGAGLQIGWMNQPDAFLVGLHWLGRPMGEELDVVPSLDFGFGDNLTMIAPNIDAHYVMKTSSKLGPYIGAGMSFPWYDTPGGSDWEFGGALIGGLHVNPNMAFEFKYGLGDAPDWKFVFVVHK